MLSLIAVKHLLRRRFRGWTPRPLGMLASSTWDIAPGGTGITPPAIYLPNQLERVTGWAFATEHPRNDMEGGITVHHSPTRGLRFENVWLIDGTLYKDDAAFYIRARSGRFPKIRVHQMIDRGAIFCSMGGATWFGDWLSDSCLTYSLAAAEAVPVTPVPPLGAHVLGYQEWLGMEPLQVDTAFFRELVLFDDVGENDSRRQRALSVRDRLWSHVAVRSHPGVFIVRGGSGERRILANEMELAEHLRDRRGFRIVDPFKSDVPTIVAACAGARAVVGIEGSGLAHGLAVLPRGASLIALQPPNRFVKYFKHHLDRNGQHFGFVVGYPFGDDFRIDPLEVERTLDILPKSSELD